MTRRMATRILSFVVWALLGLSLVFWASRLFGTQQGLTRAPAIAPPAPSVQSADIVRVLGPAPVAGAAPQATTSTAAAVAPTSTLRLLGVAAGRNQQGVALIAIDNQPARPYRVGARVDGRYTLTAVARRSATLKPEDGAAPALKLELAPLDGKTPPSPGSTAALPAGSGVAGLLRNNPPANTDTAAPPAAQAPAAAPTAPQPPATPQAND